MCVEEQQKGGSVESAANAGAACATAWHKPCLQAALGTAAYMSPEAMQGGQITERCDVYSYAILLWEVRSRGGGSV